MPDMPDRTATPEDVFRQLVTGICEKRYGELAALYAERTDVSHPMAPGRPAPLLSREDLARHFGRASQVLGPVRFTPAAITVHQTADPEVIVAEFEYRGTTPGAGEQFAIPGILVMRVRDGQIVESRDYHDHLEMARVTGRLDDVIAAARPG